MRIVIVGAGEVGFHIASRLAMENKDVVVIDRRPDAVRRVADNLDVQAMEGSGCNPAILKEAGIGKAELLLAVTDSDEINLTTCLMTDILSPATRKLARIRNAAFDPYHDTFRGKAPRIDTVINPEIEVVKTIDHLLGVPGAVDVSEFADGQIKFVGIRLETGNPLAGVRLSRLPDHIAPRRLLIAAIIRNEKLLVPGGEDNLTSGDLVYFICERKCLKQTLALFGKHAEPLKRVLIIGGGRIGYRLASLLESRLSVKIIENDLNPCDWLAERMRKTIVLHGDGSDQNLLIEENIREMDAVITLTNVEEMNILSSLLARRLGARKLIVKINKFDYLPLMVPIGIEQVVSSRLSAINTILRHIRKGKVLSAVSLKGEEAEVMEAVALETSDIVGKPLRRIPFPRGALVVGILRGGLVIIPSGESVIAANDRVILFATRRALPKLEKLLTVKLEYF